MGSDQLNADRTAIPTVDLAPFFRSAGGDKSGKDKAREMIADACRTSGFFQIVNHGMSTALMSRAIDLSHRFFSLPDEEKIKSSPVPAASQLPTGYIRHPKICGNVSEFIIIRKPELGRNVYPKQPPEFRSTLEECFTQLTEVALLVESILNDCMGLPPNFIKNYDPDRLSDVLVPKKYPPATSDEDNTGVAAHQDSSCLTLLFQDDVGGLEVLMDGRWIPVEPLEGSIVVNVGDLLQVMTNDTFVSATHRVMRKERDRCSYAFFLDADADKWIEPLARFTDEVGAAPRYRGFRFGDYEQMRMKNLSIPHEDYFDIARYAISSAMEN